MHYSIPRMQILKHARALQSRARDIWLETNMGCNLDRDDRLKLVSAFANSSEFRTENDRWCLVDAALAGVLTMAIGRCAI